MVGGDYDHTYLNKVYRILSWFVAKQVGGDIVPSAFRIDCNFHTFLQVSGTTGQIFRIFLSLFVQAAVNKHISETDWPMNMNYLQFVLN